MLTPVSNSTPVKEKISDKMKQSNTFFLKASNGEHVKVCKKFFLSTLGMKTDGVITHFLKNRQQQSVSDSSHTCPIKDMRGTVLPNNKCDAERIKDHIESYNPQVSHYRLAHAPNKRYLLYIVI